MYQEGKASFSSRLLEQMINSSFDSREELTARLHFKHHLSAAVCSIWLLLFLLMTTHVSPSRNALTLSSENARQSGSLPITP